LPPLRDEPSVDTREAWRSVWSELFQLKLAGESLFSNISKANIKRYVELLDSAAHKDGEFAFYFDRDDFERLEALLNRGFIFIRGKTSVHHLLLEPTIDGRASDALREKIELNGATIEQFSRLLAELRDRYSVRTAASTGHPVWRNDQRSRSKLADLD